MTHAPCSASGRCFRSRRTVESLPLPIRLEFRPLAEGRIQELGEIRIRIDISVRADAAYIAQDLGDLGFVAQRTQHVCGVGIEKVGVLGIALIGKLYRQRTKLVEVAERVRR